MVKTRNDQIHKTANFLREFVKTPVHEQHSQ